MHFTHSTLHLLFLRVSVVRFGLVFPAMPTYDARVDAYIGKAQPFAQPILEYLREVVHEGCPEVEEAIKWGMPHFTYKGLFCAIAGFKHHCACHIFNFKSVDPDGAKRSAAEKDGTGQRPAKPGDKGMGVLGKITSLKDLPSKRVLIGYVKKAKALKDSGVVTVMSRKKRAPKPDAPKSIEAPAYLLAALKKSKGAQQVFAGFSPSARRDYIEWLTDAKTEETRNRRLLQAIEWISQGKQRNWKYMKASR